MQEQRPARATRVETVVVGAGQAGLAVGYELAARGRSFVILESNARVGDTWRRRWDSLRLFTPARYDGIVGMPFPAPPDAFPTKDEMADYLERYAERFALPVRTGVRVERVTRDDSRYRVQTDDACYEADHVVVAMANFQRPRVPAFARELDASIVQCHSVDYRNPSQLADGPVLVVGAGNSGAEIAMELARVGREVLLAGRHTGQVPFRMEGRAARLVLARLVLRGVFHHLLTTGTPMGRRARVKAGGADQATPLIRVKRADLAAVGVVRAPRVDGVRDGRPLLADGRVVDAGSVVWCTGFESAFSWVDLPVFDARGRPVHERGAVTNEPGLYFVGLHFLYAMSSAMIHGVSRDAAHVVETIVARAAGERLTPQRLTPRGAGDDVHASRPHAVHEAVR